jgi:phosphoglycolate phosphatase-like HAD superfamily hydrolase
MSFRPMQLVMFDIDGTLTESDRIDDESRASYERAAGICGRAAFDSVIYIGDGVWDVRASTNLGRPCVGIARDPAKAARLRAEGARHVLSDYRDLEAVTRALIT